MADLPALSTRWLADHHGVITTARLREHSVGATATRQRLVERGVLATCRSRACTYRRPPRVTLEQRCAVLSAAHRGGFVTGPTAGKLAGLRRMPRRAALHYSVLHGVHIPRTPGIRFRQTTVIWAIDRHVRPDGIIVASWPRLAFDLAADLPQLDHVSVVQQLLHESKVSARRAQLAIDRRLGHPTRPGSGVFRRTLVALGGSAPNESHPEVVLADALRGPGVPVEHQTQGDPRHPSGRTMRIDLAVPAIKWGVELDIHPEHRTSTASATTPGGEREMHMVVAWQVETVTEVDMTDVDRIADELVAALPVRRRHSSAS